MGAFPPTFCCHPSPKFIGQSSDIRGLSHCHCPAATAPAGAKHSTGKVHDHKLIEAAQKHHDGGVVTTIL